MPRGIIDSTTLIDAPANIDTNYVRNLENARGMNFQRVLELIDQRLQAVAQVADPLVAALISFTTNPVVDASEPTAFDLEFETEYGVPRPEFAEKRAHMLPFERYAKALGFTEAWLEEEATEPEVLRQVDNMLRTFVRGGRIRVLRRLFDDAEVFVDRKTTAVSPGFAGSGTGDNAFGGTYPDGTALPDPYSHYYRDTSANLAATIASQIDRISRWHPGPFDLIGSVTEVGAIAALSGFTGAGSALIVPAQGDAVAQVPRDRYLGVYNPGGGAADVRVWHGLLELGSAANFAVFKTYGNFDVRNPLAWRYSQRFGRGVELRFRSLFPLDAAYMRYRFGVGVNDRTAATLTTIAASGAYVAPTIA